MRNFLEMHIDIFQEPEVEAVVADAMKTFQMQPLALL